MQSTIEGRSIDKAARAVAAVAGSRTFMPVLELAQVTTLPGSVVISGTNLETWIRYRVDTTGTGIYSEAHVNAGALAGAAKGLKGAHGIATGAGTLTLGAACLPDDIESASEYPLQPSYTIEPGALAGAIIELSGREFKALIKRHKATTRKAGQTTRINLTCVNIDYNLAGTGARFVTTDGYALNSEEYGAHLVPDDTRSLLVPLAPLQRAAAVAGMKDSVKLTALKDGAHDVCKIEITSTAGVVTYHTRGVDEQFPDYRRVIPATVNALASFTVDSSELARVVTAAGQVAPDDSGAVTVTIAPSEFTHNGAGPDILTVKSESAAGSYRNGVEITPVPGAAFDIALPPVVFNFKYLAGIAGYTDGTVTVHLAQPLQAARIDYGAGRVAVLMPVNLTR